MSDSEQVSGGSRRRRLIDEDERVSDAVLEGAAKATGEDLDSLPPLADQIDIEALDRLFASRTVSPAAGLVFTRDDDIPTEVEVRFEYVGYEVTVTDHYVVFD